MPPMTRLLPPVTIVPRATLTIAALLAVGGTGAHELFPLGGSAATAAKRHAHRGFKIAGSLPRPLAPGASQPLNLTLTNPYRFDLRITRLTVAVAVDARHAAAGCGRSANFRVTRLTKAAYPIRLRRRRTRTLRALGVRRVPRVVMRNLATNQDACKGARLRFRYAGRARRWRGARAR